MSITLLGLQVAHGFSPEARVFAGLLAHTDPAVVAASVLFQGRPQDRKAADQFGAAAGSFGAGAGSAVVPLDFGWRSVAPGRSLPEKLRSRFQFYAALPDALKAAQRAGPDVIYSCQQLWDCQAATYIARKMGKPQLIHLHYTIGPWLHTPVLKRLLTCDHVITVSDFIREEALRHGVRPEKVTTIRNTAPALSVPEPGARESVRAEIGAAPGTRLLGIVARLDPNKGQADTLTAFAEARKRFPDSRLLVIGDNSPWYPDYAKTLHGLAGTLGLVNGVHFLGRRADVSRLLASLDIFVHPSRQDPCPLAVLEAADAGLPIAAYAEGGAIELIEDGVTGLLAPPGDVPALAWALEILLGSPARAQAMGQAGRERLAREFQPEKRSREFEEIVRQAVTLGGGPKKPA